jgi:hypothetical protein
VRVLSCARTFHSHTIGRGGVHACLVSSYVPWTVQTAERRWMWSCAKAVVSSTILRLIQNETSVRSLRVWALPHRNPFHIWPCYPRIFRCSTCILGIPRDRIWQCVVVFLVACLPEQGIGDDYRPLGGTLVSVDALEPSVELLRLSRTCRRSRSHILGRQIEAEGQVLC